MENATEDLGMGTDESGGGKQVTGGHSRMKLAPATPLRFVEIIIDPQLMSVDHRLKRRYMEAV